MTDDQSPMNEVAPPIELDLPRRLRDREFRKRYFLAESSALIAEQLVALRKRRDLNQKQVAEKAGTRQSAISRAEQADYQNWSFNTLRSIADVLDARIRVLIQAVEDVIWEYDHIPTAADVPQGHGSTAWNDFFPAGRDSGPPVNDDELVPRDPELAAQAARGRLDLLREQSERRFG